MSKRTTQAVPLKAQLKPGMLEAVEVTADNLGAIITWLGYDLGSCRIGNGGGYIITNMYSEEACGRISVGEVLVRVGKHDVLQYTKDRFSQIFDVT